METEALLRSPPAQVLAGRPEPEASPASLPTSSPSASGLTSGRP